MRTTAVQHTVGIVARWGSCWMACPQPDRRRLGRPGNRSSNPSNSTLMRARRPTVELNPWVAPRPVSSGVGRQGDWPSGRAAVECREMTRRPVRSPQRPRRYCTVAGMQWVKARGLIPSRSVEGVRRDGAGLGPGSRWGGVEFDVRRRADTWRDWPRPASRLLRPLRQLWTSQLLPVRPGRRSGRGAESLHLRVLCVVRGEEVDDEAMEGVGVLDLGPVAAAAEEVQV